MTQMTLSFLPAYFLLVRQSINIQIQNTAPTKENKKTANQNISIPMKERTSIVPTCAVFNASTLAGSNDAITNNNAANDRSLIRKNNE
jgi:hypothetical protein